MTKLGGASNQPTNPNLTGYPGDLKFPGRCDRFETNFSSNWRPRLATKICYVWSLNWMTSLFVTRMEVPRSTVTWTRELGRRRTARQVEPGGLEELWWEEFQFLQESLKKATGACSWGVLLSSVTTSP